MRCSKSDRLVPGSQFVIPFTDTYTHIRRNHRIIPFIGGIINIKTELPETLTIYRYSLDYV